MEPEAQQLIAAASAGDVAAAERLIELFHGRIYAFLRRLSGQDADAADLTQRTFTRAWIALGTFAGRSSVSSWLHGIAHHLYLDWCRAERRGLPQTDAWWAALPDPGRGPADLAGDADLARTVYAAVDRLTPEQRSSVHLHYYQGLTLQETADALGVAAGTVKYRLRAALDELAAALVHRPARQNQITQLRQP